MSQTEHLLATLKRCLKTKGITYKALGRAIGLSEAGVKKAFVDENFTIKRLEQICDVLAIDIDELVRLGGALTDGRERHLTLEQEELLASDESLFVIFYLVLGGMPPTRIAADFDFTEPQVERSLLKLDKAGLIELHPGGRFRARAPLDVAWREGGPLKQRYDATVKREFLESAFDGPNERLAFVAGRLTEASARVMRRKLERLVAEFRELVELDRHAGREKRRGIWLLGAMRPWEFSAIRGKRQARPR